jgi:hypothetical protein
VSGMRRLRFSCALSAVALALAANSAAACRGPQWESSTVLPRLPASADKHDVVARVKVLELIKAPWIQDDKPWQYTNRVKARIVEAIKGVEKDQEIVVDSRGTSCDQVFGRYSLGTVGYIAGRMETSNGETVFAGRWGIDLTTGDLIPRPVNY